MIPLTRGLGLSKNNVSPLASLGFGIKRIFQPGILRLLDQTIYKVELEDV